MKIDKNNIAEILGLCIIEQGSTTKTGIDYCFGRVVILEHVRGSSKNVWVNKGISKFIATEDRKEVENEIRKFLRNDVKNVYFDFYLGYVDEQVVERLLKIL